MSGETTAVNSFAERDQLSLADRGLAYGDGLFETIRVSNGRPVFLEWHLERLQQGAQVLGIKTDSTLLAVWLGEKAAKLSNGILKLIVTRGVGGRGYKPPVNALESVFITEHELPPAPDYAHTDSADKANVGIDAFICKQRLAQQPALAGIKHLNRLEQVLASREFPDSGYHEGLMLDYQDNLVEGTRSNLFISVAGKLLTPVLDQCGIAGVMRRALLEQTGAAINVCRLSVDMLDRAEEMFFCNSVAGIWPVKRLTDFSNNGREWEFTPGAFTHEAALLFQRALA